MSTVATLDTVMRLDSAAFRQGMTQAANTANASLGSIQKQAQQTASMLLQMKRAAETFGSFYLIKEGIGSLIDAQKQLQAIEYTLNAATGSSAQATQAFQFLRDESERLGLVLPTAAQSFANLSASASAAGVSLADQMKLFDAFGRASTTLHLSLDQSSRAQLALEQMFAKGKIQAQELRLQLGQAIPGAAQRFQNAVMEMTKGTDLAGKSFDQLLEAGALTTSKFLPALVTALSESGHGAEQAATGLNAQLNRVQTAWFNLKAEMSDGLFTDAATEGAKLLASNLDHIAGTLSVLASLGAARAIGSVLQTGAGRATSYLQQNVTGPQMAAAAERDYAAALAASTREAALKAEGAALLNVVALDSAKAALADAQQQAFEAAAIRDAASAEMERVLTLGALNEALGVKVKMQAGAITLDEQQAVALEALTIAEQQLTKSRTAAMAAADGVAAAEKRMSGLRAASVAATEAQIAADNALVVAQERVAATGLASTFGAAAKSFGTFAMGLLGGPWGVAIAGLGAIGYAVYSARKEAEAYSEQTQKQVKDLEAVGQAAQAAAESFGKLGSAMSYSQARDTYNTQGKALGDAREEIQKAKDELANLERQKQYAENSASTGLSGATSTMSYALDGNIQRHKERIDELTAAYSKQFDEVNKLGSAISGPFAAATEASAFAMKHAVEAGDSLIDAAAKAKAAWEGVWASVAGDAHTQQVTNAAFSQMQSIVDSANAEMLKSGKGFAADLTTQARIAATGIAGNSSLTQAQKVAATKEVTDRYAANIELAKKADEYKAQLNQKTKTSGVDKEAEAWKNLTAAQQGQLDTLQQQLDGDAHQTEARRKLNEMIAGGNAEFRKLSDAHKQDALAMQGQIVASEALLAKKQQEAAAITKLATLQRELDDEQQARDTAAARAVEGVGHGQKWNDQQRQRQQIEDEANRRRRAEDDSYEAAKRSAMSAGKWGEQQASIDSAHLAALGQITLAQSVASAGLERSFAQMDSAEQQWKLGAQAAMEDYRDQAGNLAAQAADFFTSSMRTMEDSLVAFVTTGKLSFKSMVASILTDLARMEMRILASKILTSIIGSFAGGGSSGAQYSAAGGDGAGDGGYGMMMSNYSSGGRASGGPTSPNSLYRVAENGHPELYSEAGKTYLMTGAQAGLVSNGLPNGGGGGASGGSVGPVTVNVTMVQQSDGTSRAGGDVTATNEFGRSLGKQMQAVALSEIAKATRPNGIIDRKLRGTA